MERLTWLSLPAASSTWISTWLGPGRSLIVALNVQSLAGRMSEMVSGPGNTRTVTRPSGTVRRRTIYSLSGGGVSAAAGSRSSMRGGVAKEANWYERYPTNMTTAARTTTGTRIVGEMNTPLRMTGRIGWNVRGGSGGVARPAAESAKTALL